MAETVTMPKLGFDMQEGTLVRWVRTEGETVNKGDILAEIETDKATVEVESSASGIVRRLLVDQGEVVPIGSPIAIVGTKDEKIEVPSAAEASAPSVERAAASSTSPPARDGGAAPVVATAGHEALPTKASPLARRMAREANIDLGRVQGTGPGGRITRKDIETTIAGGASRVADAGMSTEPSVRITPRNDATVPLSKLRQAIARRMTESKSTVPHFYVTHEYKVDSLLDLREQANSVLQADEKLSVNDFVIKATALCLREYPNLNSVFQGDQVLRRGAINVGVAVSVEGGLLTVVCKDADQKPVRQISAEVKAMAGRARSGKVHPDDIDGSTFTVSNLGMFDVEDFGAIINPPEAGILAVGSARQVAVVEKGEVRAGWRMKATIAVDHRVSDGAEAAQFMQTLAKYIETPLSLFL
jgi:pyruvate dehydrogenase E2 component (dihydrolipoamide acetyltransferase)